MRAKVKPPACRVIDTQLGVNVVNGILEIGSRFLFGLAVYSALVRWLNQQVRKTCDIQNIAFGVHLAEKK